MSGYYTTEPPGDDNECLGMEGIGCAMGIIGLVALGTMFLCFCACLCGCKEQEEGGSETERQVERSRAVEEERRRRIVSRRTIENPVYTVRQKFPHMKKPYVKNKMIFILKNFSTYLSVSN